MQYLDQIFSNNAIVIVKLRSCSVFTFFNSKDLHFYTPISSLKAKKKCILQKHPWISIIQTPSYPAFSTVEGLRQEIEDLRRANEAMRAAMDPAQEEASENVPMSVEIGIFFYSSKINGNNLYVKSSMMTKNLLMPLMMKGRNLSEWKHSLHRKSKVTKTFHKLVVSTALIFTFHILGLHQPSSSFLWLASFE